MYSFVDFVQDVLSHMIRSAKFTDIEEYPSKLKSPLVYFAYVFSQLFIITYASFI